MLSEKKSLHAYVQIYSTFSVHLSLLERAASVRLQRLSRAGVRADRVEVRPGNGSRVAGRFERVGSGGQALEVLAVVCVGLQDVSRISEY